jgi:hypothetical protein
MPRHLFRDLFIQHRVRGDLQHVQSRLSESATMEATQFEEVGRVALIDRLFD